MKISLHLSRLHIIIFVVLIITGCVVEGKHSPVEKNGNVYGEITGAFRDKWWNYYEQAGSFMDGKLWRHAEAALHDALAIRPEDRRRQRKYGYHYTDYFPNRDLGICLYYQKRYPEAISSLTLSLEQAPSAKARYYLDKARKAHIRKLGTDKNPPVIHILAPADKSLVKGFSLRVEGKAADDTLISLIRINNTPVPLTIAKQKKDFHLDIPVFAGKNSIIVEAVDITGKKTQTTIEVTCDRAGPVLRVDALEEKEGNFVFRGFVTDDTGIQGVFLDDVQIVEEGVLEKEIIHVFSGKKGQEFIRLKAVDLLGNETLAELSLKVQDLFPPKAFTQENRAFYALNTPAQTATDAGAKTRGTPVYRNSPPVLSFLGAYYALIIGINEYEHWNPLQTAVHDAKSLKDVLVGKYGFPGDNVLLRLNGEATKTVLDDDIITMTSKLTDNDNLLIYYAGHGQKNPEIEDGYWIPADGRQHDSTTWIQHTTVKNLMANENIEGKNIIVITDSCYGAYLTRGQEPLLRGEGITYTEKLLYLAGKRSRQVISSGGIERVADWGCDGHSVFACFFLNALQENTRALVDLRFLMNSQVFANVTGVSGQRPVMSRFPSKMDDDGEFVLFRPDKLDDEEREVLETASLQRKYAPKPEKSPWKPAYPFADKDHTPPEIIVRKWKEKEITYADKVYIQGEAKDDDPIQKLTINGKHICDGPGRRIFFAEMVSLNSGNNLIVIECNEKTRKKLYFEQRVPEVKQNRSRMKVALVSFNTFGDKIENADDVFLNYLFDTRRFNIVENISFSSDTGEEPSPRFLQNLKNEHNVDAVIFAKAVAKENRLEITARIVDTASAELLATEDVYKEGEEKNMLWELCEALTYNIVDAFPLAEGIVVDAAENEIIVNIGSDTGLAANMELIVYSMGKQILDPKTGEVLSRGRIRQLAFARVTSVEEKITYAGVTKIFEPGVRISQNHRVIAR